MPPYGIDSLLNRDFDTQGYFTSPVEEIYDPAFGTLNFNRAYGPAPFTGNIPLTSYRVEPGLQYLSDDGRLINLGFEGDIDLPSFGGVSGYRNTGGIMDIEPAVKSGIETVDKVQGFVEDDDIEASAIPEFKEGELKQPGGIANFLKAILGFAIPGANLFMGDRSALQGIRSLNQRLRNTDFGRSKTLQEYFQKKEAKREAKRLAPIEKQLREASERGGGYQPTTRSQNVARTSSRVSGGRRRAYGL
tara:strand:- start:472 stop:1212 length:741 start_codon:yes stop_codon:yes gene_type:complete